MTLDFDSDGWRDEMANVMRTRFLAAETQAEQREIADVLLLLNRGKDAAKARREGQA